MAQVKKMPGGGLMVTLDDADYSRDFEPFVRVLKSLSGCDFDTLRSVWTLPEEHHETVRALIQEHLPTVDANQGRLF